MQQKSITKNILMSSVLTVSNFLFPLITYAYVARVLNPDRMGQVAFVDSILAYFIYIASLGIPSYGMREVAKLRGDKERISGLVQELFVLNTGTTILSYLLLWIAVATIPKLQIYSALFLVMGGQIALRLIGVEWLYQGLEEYSYITITSLIFKAISVVLTFVLVRTEQDVLWYGFVHVFTISASCICNFINIRKYVSFQKKRKYNFKAHLKPILVLFSASVAITIYAYFDISMLGFSSTEYEVGLYNAAQKIKSIVLALSAAVTAVFVPRIAYYFARKEKDQITELLSKSLRISFITALPISVYIILFSEWVLEFIGGSEYIAAGNVLRVLMLCVFALIATNFCGAQILIPVGREKRYTQSVVVGLFINLTMNALLIPYIGALGAAIGTLITEVWNVVWMGSGGFDFVKQVLKNVSFRGYFLAMVVAGAFSILFASKLTEISVFFQLVITSVVYFGIYFLFLLFNKEPLLLKMINNVKARIR